MAAATKTTWAREDRRLATILLGTVLLIALGVSLVMATALSPASSSKPMTPGKVSEVQTADTADTDKETTRPIHSLRSGESRETLRCTEDEGPSPDCWTPRSKLDA